MLKRLFLSIICLIAIEAQGQSIFVFFDDDKGKDRNVYLFESSIIDTLKNLHQPNRPDSLIFDDVLDNSTLKGIDRFLDDIRLIINDREKIYLESNEEGEKVIRTDNQKLLTVDYILAIKVITLNTTLRFNITLFETFKSKKKNAFLAVKLETAKRLSVNVVERDLEADEKKFLAKIQSLFPQSNKPPTARIRVNQQLLSNNKLIEIGLGDTLNLDGGYSSDSNHIAKLFDYEWKQDAKSKGQYEILSLKSNPIRQTVTMDKLGTHTIYLKVGDGIHESSEAKIRIKVVERPVIQLLSDTLYELREQGNLISFGIPFKQRLRFHTPNVSKKDTLVISLDSYQTYDTEEFILLNDTTIARYEMNRGRLKLAFKKRFQPGYYKFEVRTEQNLIRSEPQYFSVDYKTDDYIGMTLIGQNHYFTYFNGVDNPTISANGFLGKVEGYIIFNLGFELGLSLLNNPQIGGNNIDIVGPDPIFNHFALLYRIHNTPYKKPYTKATIYLARRYILNDYNPLENTISYVPRVGIGGEISVQLYKKLYLDLNVGYFRNQYAPEDLKLLEGRYNTLSIGLSYMGSLFKVNSLAL